MALKASPYHETNQRQQEKSEETHREAAKKNHPMTLPPELPSSDTGETEPHRSRLCATSNAFGRPTPRPTAPRPTAPRRGPRPRGSRGLTSAARPGAPELLQARARGGRGRRRAPRWSWGRVGSGSCFGPVALAAQQQGEFHRFGSAETEGNGWKGTWAQQGP